MKNSTPRASRNSMAVLAGVLSAIGAAGAWSIHGEGAATSIGAGNTTLLPALAEDAETGNAWCAVPIRLERLDALGHSLTQTCPGCSPCCETGGKRTSGIALLPSSHECWGCHRHSHPRILCWQTPTERHRPAKGEHRRCRSRAKIQVRLRT